jgi:hypothetical protein
MTMAGGSFDIEELDSPLQRVVARKKVYILAPAAGAAFALTLLVWEIVRRNLPADALRHWPWRLELLDLQSASTILTVLLIVLFTRMQYAETVRPVLGWTLVPPHRDGLPVPGSRDQLMMVNAFNGGNGGTVIESVRYRMALLGQPQPTPWLAHDAFYAALETAGLVRNQDFHFSYLRSGLPLLPGESALDKGVMVALFTRAALVRFRILDIRVRFRDQLGDLHERILPVRAVYTEELGETLSTDRSRGGPRPSLLATLADLFRRSHT